MSNRSQPPAIASGRVMTLRPGPSGHSAPLWTCSSLGQSLPSYLPRLLLRNSSPVQNGYAWWLTALGVEK